MLNSKSFLGLDFGAGTLKVAEFEASEAGGLRLKQFGVRSLGREGSQEAKREAVLLRAAQELFAERGFASRQANICAPGYHVFSKFVKLPPVDSSKVTQIIQYEAQQNVPFPLEEVVWDYQILGTTQSGELEVLLVAIKADVVEGLFRSAEGCGLRLNLVDVSPAALCNAFRYNYGDLEGCTMLLDIGAKTSNVLFFEKGKVFSRGINIGANSITQDFGAEAKLRFPEAERIKVEEGFVSLGGAYEEPENPHQAAISKIARQVMTRLHIQVNQTIQFYRSQQGGSAPQRLFLAGGASVMPYTAQFFAEKLNLPVDYFNPFRSVQIDPSVNLEELARVAHSFGEVVGLGLRNLAQCPVELNLVPKSLRKQQQFNQKKPYFVAALFSLVAVVFALGVFYSRMTAITKDAVQKVQTLVQPLQDKENRLRRVENQIGSINGKINQFTGWLQDRTSWGKLLEALRSAFLQTETQVKKQVGVDVGVWVINMWAPGFGHGSEDLNFGGQYYYQPQQQQNPFAHMSKEMMMRYHLGPYAHYTNQTTSNYGQGGALDTGGSGGTPAASPGASTTTASTSSSTSTNEIRSLKLVCRAVDLQKILPNNPTANDLLFYSLKKQLDESQYFTVTNAKLTKDQNQTDQTNQMTFRFEVTVALKHPIKL